MHKRATWVVVGFIAVLVIAATLDAVFFRSHAPAATGGTTSEASVTGFLSVPFSAAPPRCTSHQLELTINSHGPPPPQAPHDDYVSLTHSQGRACSFSGFIDLRISTIDGPARGVLRIDPNRRDFTDAYGPAFLNGTHLLRFRYSPKCGERGPFVAVAHVGPYVASREIRVFRCGITPPPFPYDVRV